MWVLWALMLNGMVAAGSYLVARHVFQQGSGLRCGLAGTIVGWTWVTLGVEFLGSAGWLERPALLGWSTALFVVGLLACMYDRMRGQVRAGGGSLAKGSWGFAATLAVGLVLWVGTVLFVQSLLFPVKVVSDGPIYHLYFAVKWWKARRLFLVPTPFGESAAPYFPAVGDLWFTWLVTCWGGDRLARVGQVPFLLVAALAAAGLARSLEISSRSAVLAACWFVSCTPLFLFSFEPNVDTIFTAGYLLAAYFFLLYARGQGDHRTLILGGLAAGAALGTKAPGILFVPVLVVLAAWAAWRRAGSLSSRLAHVAIAGLSPLLVAGNWYARNAWLTGNPFYPLHVAVFGHVWLSGWYGTDAMMRSQYYLARNDWRAGLDLLLAVLDPRLAPVWLFALAGGWALRGRAHEKNSWIWLASGLAVLNVALFWVLVPYRTQQRFMLHALGLAAVPLGRLFDRGRLWRALGIILLSLHMVTSQGWPLHGPIPWDLSDKIPNNVPGFLPLPQTSAQWSETLAVPERRESLLIVLGIGVGALATAMLWARMRAGPGASRSWQRCAAAIGATSALLVLAAALTFPWGPQPRWRLFPFFPDYLAGWTELDRLTAGHASRIAYAGTNLPYYLMGNDFRNEVKYININAHPGWLLHDYHRALGSPTSPYPRPDWDRAQADYAAWLKNLRRERIDYLVVTRVNPVEGPKTVADAQGFPIERVWADAHPDVFVPTYGIREGDRLLQIYRIRPEGEKTAPASTAAASRSH